MSIFSHVAHSERKKKSFTHIFIIFFDIKIGNTNQKKERVRGDCVINEIYLTAAMLIRNSFTENSLIVLSSC